MYFIILLFLKDLVLVVSHARQYLSCSNDYESKMVCHFTSEKVANCSEYNLDLNWEPPSDEWYNCVFKSIEFNGNVKCECTIIIMAGFIIGEYYKADLLNAGEIVYSKLINTSETIKPKVPTILWVNQTENGNFLVTWETNYRHSHVFSDSLKTELSYRTKGRADLKAQVENVSGMSTFEIVGSYLTPNTNYILKARIYSAEYKSQLSDWSKEYEWTTSASTSTIGLLDLLIPALCVILTIIISTLFYCYVRIKTECWDKVSTPKIDPMYSSPGQCKVLPPPHIDLSTLCVDFPDVNFTEEKILTSSEADFSHGNSHHSVRQEMDSASVDYAHTCSGSQQQNVRNIAHVQNALSEVFGQFCPIDNLPHKSLLSPSSETYNICKDGDTLESNQVSSLCSPKDVHSENPSDYNNRTYLQSISSESSFSAQPLISCDSGYRSYEREVLNPTLSSNSAPLMSTDFEYRSCDSRSMSAAPAEDTSLTQTTHETRVFTSSLMAVEEAGYQSFNEVTSKANGRGTDFSMDPAFESSQSIDEPIENTLICSKNPLHPSLPSHRGSLAPSDNGYQALQSLGQSTGDQWSLEHRTEPAQHDCGLWNIPQNSTERASHHFTFALHTPPVMEIGIEHSYHRV